MRHLPANTLERQVTRPHDAGLESVDFQARQAIPDTSEDAKLYLNVLKRRKWCIIIPVLVIFPIAAAFISTEKPAFLAKSRILIEKNTPVVLEIQDVVRNDPSEDFYQTEFSLITSRENLGEVVDILQLDKKPSVPEPMLTQVLNAIVDWPKKAIKQLQSQVMALVASTSEAPTGETPVAMDPAELRRMAAINLLLLSTQVTPIEGTRLVDVVVKGENPQEVAKITNTLTEVYVRKNQEARLETSRKAMEWLAKKTADLKEKMQVAERNVQDFREKRNLVSLDFEGRRNLVQERLVSLYNAYTQANTSRIDFEARLNKVKSLSADNLESIESLSAIGDVTILKGLRQSYLDLSTQYRNAAESFTPKHPKMVQLQVQLDETKRALNQELQKIVGALQAEYNILRTKEGTLARELNAQKDSTLGLGNDMITYTALQRDADNQRNLYTETAKRLEEIKLTQAASTNNVKIVESAVVPLLPTPSKGPLMLVGSLCAAGMLGVGCAFILEYFANRFKNADEIEQYLRIPFLGVIPQYGVGRRRRGQLISLREPMSSAAEAYRLLRTRLFPAMLGMKTLLVTSAVPAEGKSTTVANLGVSFAQLGLKVLVVDLDMRRPSLHRQFQIPKDPGLTNALGQEVAWQDVLRDTSMSNLQVISTGPLPYNPSDLLCLGSLRQFFVQAKEVFDLVLVDAPLILAVPDVEILAPDMDGVLMVHDPRQCDRKSVLEARRRLDRVRAHILGIVLNNVETKHQHFYYHSYYGGYQVTAPVLPPAANGYSRFIESSHKKKPSIAKTTKKTMVDTEKIGIVIHDFQVQKEIHGTRAADKRVFLILNIEVANKLEAPYYFRPESTRLYIEAPENYGISLSSMVRGIPGASGQDIEMDSMYKYSDVTEGLADGLMDERIIPPYEKVRGSIVFQVPESVHDFVLAHENELINISLSTIKNA